MLEITVQDIDRQFLANISQILVHPAAFYVGLRFATRSASGRWNRFVATDQIVPVIAVQS